jgi:hypothetical protein
MGRPKKNPIILHNPTPQVAGTRRNTVKFRPVRFFEVLITTSAYAFESHFYDENGVEYIKKGGDK